MYPRLIRTSLSACLIPMPHSALTMDGSVTEIPEYDKQSRAMNTPAIANWVIQECA